jgi:hypothetical protein
MLLQGNQTGPRSTISFPVDITSANGTYVLATPTDGNNTNEQSGLWFMQWPPAAGLELPTLPEGWIYSGWAINSNVTVPTGNFTSSEGVDNFSGYSSIIEQPYGFPGEDFLVNPPNGLTFPLNLSDGASQAMISVEPDISIERPFFIQPLITDIPANATTQTTYDMNQNLDSIPSGTVRIEEYDFPVHFKISVRREAEADSIEVSKQLLSELTIDPKWYHMAGQPEEGEALERSIFTGAGNYTLEMTFTITDRGNERADMTIYFDNLQLICYGKAYYSGPARFPEKHREISLQCWFMEQEYPS